MQAYRLLRTLLRRPLRPTCQNACAAPGCACAGLSSVVTVPGTTVHRPSDGLARLVRAIDDYGPGRAQPIIEDVAVVGSDVKFSTCHTRAV